MNKRYRSIWLGLLLTGLALGLTGCAANRHAHQGTAANLELNEGKKWVVDKPMLVHLKNLEKAVQDSDTQPNPDHTLLAKNIEQNLGGLVTNCTMKGQAHDELHKWLMPVIGLSADYSRATDPQVQREKLQAIKQSLVVFNEYFE